MAQLTMTAAVTGTSVAISWDNAMPVAMAYNVTVKRFPSGTAVGDDFDADDFAAGTAVGTAQTTKSGTVTDNSAAANTSYVYVIYDENADEYISKTVTTHSGKQFSDSFEEKDLLAGSQTSVFVSNQNTYGQVTFQLPITAGHIAVIAVKTDSELTESALSALFTGTNDKFQILAQDEVTAVTGMTAKIDGRLHLKYDAQS